jgi:O-antigen ligase/tetratricopeptide (TPR) repeat protein
VAALLLASSWVGYFLFTPMPQITFHVFPATLTLHIVASAGVLLYALYLLGVRRLPGGSPLDVPVLALLGAYALATYTSVDWRASLEPVLLLGAAVAVFYALSDLPLLSARSLRIGFMLMCGGLSLYALWVVGNDYADYLRLTDSVEGIGARNIFPPTVPRVHNVSDHPNVLAMVLVLAFPFYAVSAYKAEAWWERALGAAGLPVAGWAIFLTLSRGGWIGAVVGTAIALACAWITVSVWMREREGARLTWEAFVPAGLSPTALAAVIGALALAVFGGLAFVASWSTRPGWLFRASLSAREDAWSAGWDIFKDNPVTGSGPNTFGLLYPQYGEHVAQFVVHTQHAHNGFLQVANDAGLLGLLALMGIAVAAGSMLWRVWRSGPLELRLTAVACAAAVVGFAAHQQLDAGNIWKAPAFALAVVGAIVVRSYRESMPAEVERRWPRTIEWRTGRVYGALVARAALLFSGALLLAGWYRVDRAHYDYWRGLEDWHEGRTSGIARLLDAVERDTSMMVYQLELGVAQATAFDTTGRTNEELLRSAIVHLERAAEIDPRSDLARANLARAYALAGRDDDAAEQARLARLATYHVTPVLVVGEVYEELGRDEDAVSTYGQVISMDAGLANSTFWQVTPWRRDHYDEILQASTIGINPCTYGAFLVEAHRSEPATSTDGLAEAREGCQFLIFTGGLGNDLLSRVALGKILVELAVAEEDADARRALREEARGHLDFAVDRQPDFGPARTELGIWHADEGNLDEARRQWSKGAQLEQGESARLLGDSYPAGEVPGEVRRLLEDAIATSGSTVRHDLISILYYRMRYWRLSPVFALIPGTWQDAVPRPYAEWQAALERWDRQAAEGGS